MGLSDILALDGRPFRRGMYWTWQHATKVWQAITHLRTALAARHDNDGAHNGREVCLLSASYAFNAGTGDYDLMAGFGPCPTTITPLSAGRIGFTFTSPAPESSYDILITCSLDAGGNPGRWGFDHASRVTTGFIFEMFEGTTAYPGANANLAGFSIRIAWGS